MGQIVTFAASAKNDTQLFEATNFTN